MLNGIVLNSITVTIETLTYRKSIADKLISSSHGYPDLTDRASQLIDTLTRGIYERCFVIAEAFPSLVVSPAIHRQSPSFRITKAEATSLSNQEPHKRHMNSLSDRLSFTSYLRAHSGCLH